MTWGRIGTLAVLLVGLIAMLMAGRYPFKAYREVVAEDAMLVARIDTLLTEIDSLRAFSDSLDSDPAVQERVARARFGMIRPGEIAVLLVAEAPPTDSSDRR